MSSSAESDAKRALSRLRRALEKAETEIDAVRGALRNAEGADFPADEFNSASERLQNIVSFIDEQEQRLADKILHTGGLEPGRVRRSL